MIGRSERWEIGIFQTVPGNGLGNGLGKGQEPGQLLTQPGQTREFSWPSCMKAVVTEGWTWDIVLGSSWHQAACLDVHKESSCHQLS